MRKLNRKFGVIYITYDGIVNSYCGVGTVSRAFIGSYNG